MAQKSKIEWTHSTWNPITGCTKISEGCTNCYAESMARRLCAMGQKKYKNGFNLTLHPDCLEEPLKFKKPHLIFVCSMSDLFHKDVPDEYIGKVFETMNIAHWHTFQILTKRSERLREISAKLNWTPNIWAGVTVESDRQKVRVKDLVHTDAKIKYLSIEPMLSAINDLPLDGIDWVVVGGESGPKARVMKEEWVLPIRDKCLEMNVAFFFKQWGGVNKKATGNLLQGELWQQMPEVISTELFQRQLFPVEP
jgi:protein gp37